MIWQRNYVENPYLPSATVTEMVKRPTTKEWLDEAYSAEKGGNEE